MSEEELYFELSAGGYSIRIEPLGLNFPDAQDDWDSNWINARIDIKTRSFSGGYKADLMTMDFERFKQELILLYDDLKGVAKFNSLESYLEMEIEGDGLGHFEVKVHANDSGDPFGSRLSFSLNFDQTYIKELVNQLDRITKRFPIRGDFKIKNK